MRYASLILIAAAVLLGGCSRVTRVESAPGQAAAAPPTDTARQDSGTAEVPVQKAAEIRPWYADRLEALGFYVFPAPLEVPAFSIQPREGGSPIGPSEMRGKVTMLNFWATWCPPCREEMPTMENLQKAMKGEAFAIAAVSVKESSGTVDSFLKKNPYTFPIYLDPSGAASDNFVSRGIPTTFLLDKDARAIAAIVGSRSYDEPEVISLFRDLARR